MAQLFTAFLSTPWMGLIGFLIGLALYLLNFFKGDIINWLHTL